MLKILRISIISTLVFIGLSLVLVVFSYLKPGLLIKAVLPYITKSTPYKINVSEINGNFSSGLILKDIEINQPGLQCLIPLLKIKFDLKKVIHREYIFEKVEIVNPTLNLTVSEFKKEKVGNTDSRGVIFSAQDTQIHNGKLIWVDGSSKYPDRIENINSQMAIDPNQLHVKSLGATGFRSTMTVTGVVNFNPISVDLFWVSSGLIKGSGEVNQEQSLTKWKIKVSGSSLFGSSKGSYSRIEKNLSGDWDINGDLTFLKKKRNWKG